MKKTRLCCGRNKGPLLKIRRHQPLRSSPTSLGCFHPYGNIGMFVMVLEAVRQSPPLAGSEFIPGIGWTGA
jgi:hypothetical protein